MVSFQALAILVGLLFGAIVPLLAQEQDDEPPAKCCMPDKFTTQKYIMIETNDDGNTERFTVVKENQNLAYDFEQNFIGAHVSRTYGWQWREHKFRYVDDMEHQHMWVVTDDGRCSKETFDMFKDIPFRCVPENATFMNTQYHAEADLYVDTWSFIRRDIPETGWYTISLTQGDCLPFMSTFVGMHIEGISLQYMVSTSIYSSTEIGIQDPDYYFKLPASCPDHAHEHEDVIGNDDRQTGPDDGGADAAVKMSLHFSTIFLLAASAHFVPIGIIF